MALMDATCPKCGKRFRWSGKMIDKPACPKCGHRDSQEELQKTDQELEEMEKEIFKRMEKQNETK